MKIFADASALVAVIAQEPEHQALFDAFDKASVKLWSALSCWETVVALRSNYGMPVARALAELNRLEQLFELQNVPIAGREQKLALDAYEIYGRGSGHGAKLNFGDCFAYACAKANDAQLLYKGDDFALTDLA